MIAIIDYRAGNLTSVKKAFDRVSRNAVVTADPQVVTKADKIVLPGVGHFPQAEAPSVFFDAVNTFLQGSWPTESELRT